MQNITKLCNIRSVLQTVSINKMQVMQTRFYEGKYVHVKFGEYEA